MRIKKNTVAIRIDQELKEVIEKDRDHFQEVIGSGKWSLNDTLWEWKKILNSVEQDAKDVAKKTKKKCKDGCVYSKSMDQQYPRLCIRCGVEEDVKEE